MRSVTLFIAMSLDGYIADCNGKVDWLQGQQEDGEESDSYERFTRTIDTVLLGWNTYEQIVTELSVGEWVYDDFTSYVFTHRQQPSTEKIRFTDADPVELVKQLREKDGKGIWVCGGANLAQQLMAQGMVDRYEITVIPTLLGDGVRLFPQGPKPMALKLESIGSCNGMVELVYTKR